MRRPINANFEERQATGAACRLTTATTMRPMSILQLLRHAKLLARFVLVWFAMSIAAAIASPLVKPQALELICSGAGGMKLLQKTDDGSPPTTSHTLDCPLCVGIGAPPPPLACAATESMQAPGYVLQGIPTAHIAALSAAPLPARGPPASL